MISHFDIQRVEVGNARIYLIPSYIEDDDMSRLMRAATFALSASNGEGQNLPLLEGMAHGQIPVAPRHTAMLDYVRSDIGCVVASHPVSAPPQSSYLGDAALRAHISAQEDISLALAEALNLSDADIEARSRACRALVASQYSVESVAQSLRSAFGSM
jgi:glycosyltransferase involved in cell wall biosynthesis